MRFKPINILVLAVSVVLMTIGRAEAQKPDLVWMRGGHVQLANASLPFSDIEYSPDGKLLATVGGGMLEIWRVADAMLLRSIDWNRTFADNFTGFIAFSPSGDRIAGMAGPGVYFWNVPDLKPIGFIPSGGGSLRCFAMSRDWSMVATGSDDKTVRLFRTSDGAPLRTFTGHIAAVDSVGFSPDSAWLVSGAGENAKGNDQTWRTWNIASGLAGPLNQGPSVPIGGNGGLISYGVSFSSDGSQICLSILAAYFTRCIFQATSGTLASQYAIPCNECTSTAAVNNLLSVVRWSPDGLLGAVGIPGGYYLFNAADGSNLRGFSPINYAMSLCFSPDSKTLSIGNANPVSPLQVRSVANGDLVMSLTPPGQNLGNYHALAVSPDGQTIASAAEQLILRRSSDGIPYASGGTTGSSGQSIAFSPDGARYAHAEANQIVVGRVADGAPLYALPIRSTEIQFSPDGKYLVVLSTSGQFRIVNVTDGSDAFTGPANIGSGFQISPDGKYMVLRKNDSTQLYTFPSFGLVKTCDFPGSTILHPYAWSPDGKTLVRLHTNGGVDCLSIPDLSVVWRNTSLPITSPFDTCTVSPDGQVVAIASQDLAKLWLVAAPDGQLLTEFGDETYFPSGNLGGLKSVAYSPNGKFIYYGRGDGTLCCALNPFRNSVLPDHGGNTGIVTVRVITPDTFPVSDYTNVTLRDGIHPDISVDATRVNDHVLSVRFNLRGAEIGARDVVITRLDGRTLSHPKGFLIEQGRAADLAVTVLGRPLVRRGRLEPYDVVLTNRGNVDAFDATLALLMPSYATYTAPPAFPYPPDLGFPWLPSATFDTLPHSVTEGTNNVLQYWLPRLDAGASTGFRMMVATTAGLGTSIQPLQAEVSHGEETSFARTGSFEDIRSSPVFDSVVQSAAAANGKPGDLIEIANLAGTLESLVKKMFAWREALDDLGDALLPAADPLDLYLGVLTPNLDNGLSLLRKALLVVSTNRSMDGDSHSVTEVGAIDPNGVYGPVGSALGGWLSAAQPLDYVVNFANVGTTPAAEIRVTDRIDPTVLDTTTVQIGMISVQGKTIAPSLDVALPIGSRQFYADLDLRPDKNLIVRIHGYLDLLTGDLTWDFSTIDPATNLPPDDPTVGFLAQGEEGSVAFSIRPKQDLPVGTVLENSALISFDSLPKPTNVWMNTIDSAPPVSSVSKLPAKVTTSSFSTKWTGADVGSGLRDYSIYVSTDGGFYIPWRSNVAQTSSTFTGVGGHSYKFYSLARDNAGNIEWKSVLPDTFTTVTLCVDNIKVVPNPVAGSLAANGKVTLTGPAPGGGAEVALSSSSGIVGVPTSVTVPDGLTSVNFPVTTTAVAASTSVTISATWKSIKKVTTLKVRPIGIASVTFNPTSVRSTGTTTGTVTLEAPAAPGDITVALTSGNAALLTVPASVTIAQGTTTGTFTAQAKTATVSTSVKVNATAAGITKTGTVKVLANGVASIVITPNPVVGGTSATATITLDAVATANTTVSLYSSAPGVAWFVDGSGTTITSVVILSGAKSKGVKVKTAVVTANKNVTLKATANGLAKSGVLTITP